MSYIFKCIYKRQRFITAGAQSLLKDFPSFQQKLNACHCIPKAGYPFQKWKELERAEMTGVRKNPVFLSGLFGMKKICNL